LPYKHETNAGRYKETSEFCDENSEFYAYFVLPSDWVVFCWLFERRSGFTQNIAKDIAARLKPFFDDVPKQLANENSLPKWKSMVWTNEML
jgi:hypothetical protein